MSVLQFTYRKTGLELVKKGQQLEVEQTLLGLLERNKRGEVVGLWYMFDRGDGNHHYGLAGSYDQNPALAFAPACKSMHALSLIIDNAGQTGIL